MRINRLPDFITLTGELRHPFNFMRLFKYYGDMIAVAIGLFTGLIVSVVFIKMMRTSSIKFTRESYA